MHYLAQVLSLLLTFKTYSLSFCELTWYDREAEIHRFLRLLHNFLKEYNLFMPSTCFSHFKTISNYSITVTFFFHQTNHYNSTNSNVGIATKILNFTKQKNKRPKPLIQKPTRLYIIYMSVLRLAVSFDKWTSSNFLYAIWTLIQ